MSISGPEKQEADLELWVNSPLNYSGNVHNGIFKNSRWLLSWAFKHTTCWHLKVCSERSQESR